VDGLEFADSGQSTRIHSDCFLAPWFRPVKESRKWHTQLSAHAYARQNGGRVRGQVIQKTMVRDGRVRAGQGSKECSTFNLRRIIQVILINMFLIRTRPFKSVLYYNVVCIAVSPNLIKVGWILHTFINLKYSNGPLHQITVTKIKTYFKQGCIQLIQSERKSEKITKQFYFI